MARKLLFALTILFFLFLPSAIYAQTTTGTDSAASRLKKQMQEIQVQRKAAISDVKQEAKEVRAELKQQIKEAVAVKREAIKDALTAKREEFRTKLQTIKDEKKKILVDRIDSKLTNVNAKHTDRFIHVLSNLQTLLDKINENLDKTQAQVAIDAAKLAVEDQAVKTYTITISTETALRSDVGAVVSQLRQDLTSAHKLIVDAKQEVQGLKDSANL